DQFKLPEGFEEDDPKLMKDAVKEAAMTHYYGSALPQVAYKLQDSPLDYGRGLGDAVNIGRLLARGPQEKIKTWFLPACRAIADRVDEYDGFVLTDPYDGATVRWNPPRRRQRPVRRKDTVVYVNVPVGAPNAKGDYPVDRE